MRDTLSRINDKLDMAEANISDLKTAMKMI